MNRPLLTAKGITKRFPGVLALDNVDLHVYPGKVNAVVGENGAGKSTLMNILSGVYSSYEGGIYLDEEPVSFRDTTDARKAGISMIHQELNLVPNLSISENIYLGRESLNRSGLIDYSKMNKDATDVLKKLDFHENVSKKISELRVGQQQIVEIGKALSFNARILIMDEPTSALSESETEVLFRLIDSLTSNDVAILYITHKMDELEKMADTITILRDGKLIKEVQKKDITIDKIVTHMVGRKQQDFFVKEEHPEGNVLLEVKDLELFDPVRKTSRLSKISFNLRSAEVLGIYGLLGAGRTELLECIFGLHSKYSSGSIFINEQEVELHHPDDAINHGIGLIPENRKEDGLVEGMSISENISLTIMEKMLRYGFINGKKELQIAEHYRKKLDIKSYSPRQTVGKLSGGNQQKVVLSKWLGTDPRILVLDEPTRGIDVNAKNEIYKLINELAGAGMAIIVVSSELPEIMAISDRIITLCLGRLTGEFKRDQFSEEGILKCALPDGNRNQSI